MSHPQQVAFFRLLAYANVDPDSGARVLEIGSYDVNGTVRGVFKDAYSYIGVDLIEGPGVDVVGYGHEVDLPPASLDFVLCGEVFEHDPHWDRTFAKMIELTRPGGMVAFTCGGRRRPEHGTRRTKASHSPGTQFMGHDYYRNLEERDFVEAFDLSEHFSAWLFHYLPSHFDLYFAGIRRGATEGRTGTVLPAAADVAALDGLMPLHEKIARVPLRVAARVLDDDRYQDFAVPYCAGLGRLNAGLGSVAGTRRTAASRASRA